MVYLISKENIAWRATGSNAAARGRVSHLLKGGRAEESDHPNSQLATCADGKQHFGIDKILNPTSTTSCFTMKRRGRLESVENNLARLWVQNQIMWQLS